MNSEDDDFSSYTTSSKKLASLFEKNEIPAGGNLSLMYKAPKQPRDLKQAPEVVKSKPTVKKKSPFDDGKSLIYNTPVHTFKLENNKYVSIGKTEVALLKSTDQQYHMILYQNRSDILTEVIVNSLFNITVQPNNYATFYDQNKQVWLILFASTEAAICFLQLIALKKWQSEGRSKIFSQDLVKVQDERSVKYEDHIEISYSVDILLPEDALNKGVANIEGELIMLEKSLAAVQSWKNSLIGMCEGSKRLIMLPSNLLDKFEKYLPENVKICRILLNVLIKKIIIENDSKDLDKKLLNFESSCTESVDGKKNSDIPCSTRANLISRMAKMGQPILPLKGARIPTSGISDSSETEEDGVSASSDSIVKTSKISSIKSGASKQILSQPPINMSNSTNQLQTTVNPIKTAQMTSPIQPQMIHGITVSRDGAYDSSLMQQNPYTVSNYSSQELSMFLTEQRTHNSELRMNINRVSDKIDKVIDKMDNTESVNKLLEHLQSLEENILSHLSLVDKRGTISNESLKSCDFKILNKSKSSESDEQLKIDNTSLMAAVSQSRSKLDDLQAKLERLESFKQDLEKQLLHEKESRQLLERERTILMNELKIQSSNQEKAVDSWNSLADKTASIILQLENKIKEKNLNRYKDNRDDVEKLMTNVFVNIKNRFSNDSSYTSYEIHEVLADVIKSSTLEYLRSQSPNKSDNIIKESSSNLSIESSCIPVSSSTIRFGLVSQNLESNEAVEVTAVETRVNKNDSTCSDLKNKNQPDNVLSSKMQENNSLSSIDSNMPIGQSSGDISNTSCVTELLKMKDEIVEKLENNSRSTTTASTTSTTTNSNASDENWQTQPPPLVFEEKADLETDDWLTM